MNAIAPEFLSHNVTWGGGFYKTREETKGFKTFKFFILRFLRTQSFLIYCTHTGRTGT